MLKDIMDHGPISIDSVQAIKQNGWLNKRTFGLARNGVTLRAVCFLFPKAIVLRDNFGR
jgi:hypothetical protein